MDRYELLAIAVLSLFLIPIGYIVSWVISAVRSKSSGPPPMIASEEWNHGDSTIEVLYPQDKRPADQVLSEIKAHLNQYVEMVFTRIRETGEYLQDIKSGISLETLTFPLYDDEQEDFDFSLDFKFDGETETFLSAYFKNGKVDMLSAGD